jgi:hypothetical protein
MRILYVAMAHSIHVARFLRQVDHMGWDLHLFNSHPDMGPGHPLLRNITLHGCRFWQAPPNADSSVRLQGFWPLSRGSFLANKVSRYFFNIDDHAARRLARLIKKLRPDVIHSHEIQHGGYLMSRALQYLDGKPPPWIVTNWGSDVFFFGKLKEHEPQIRKVLSTCDYYTCETQRDVRLATEHGFRGQQLLPVMPNPGGFCFDELAPLRRPGPTSQRRLLMLKGYQGLFGRALVGLYALELCKDLLRGYKVAITSATNEVKCSAEILARAHNLDIDVIRHTDNYDDVLRLRGQARASIGLSVSDAASISFLEALAMGSFPIQSERGGAHEWIRNGEDGFIVHPDDPHQVAAALRRALTDDDLVNRAAERNLQVARERMDFYRLREHVVGWYQRIAEAREGQSAAGSRRAA